MSNDELLAFFLNHDSPGFEKIQDADTKEEAVVIAHIMLLEEDKRPTLKQLTGVVEKIRNA